MDSSFYNNICDNLQSQLRIARVGGGYNKKSRDQVVLILWFEDSAALYPPRKNGNFQETSSFGRQNAHFPGNLWQSKQCCFSVHERDTQNMAARYALQKFGTAFIIIFLLKYIDTHFFRTIPTGQTKSAMISWSIYRFHYRIPKMKLNLQNQKKLSAHYQKDINEYPNRQINLSFWFGSNNSCVFSVEKFELHSIQFIVTKASVLTIAKFTISLRTNFALLWILKQLRANTMCSTFTPDCRYGISLTKTVGSFHHPNEMFSG